MRKSGTNYHESLRFFGFLSIVFLLTGITACDKVQLTMPQLSYDETPKERFPFAVSYAFDPKLLQATLPTDGCDLPYTIPSGKIITETFLEESRERFAGVSTLATQGQAIPAQGSHPLTIRLNLINQAFVPTNRIGQEDRYLANVNLQLLAVYVDAQGKELAQTPLQYSTSASMWTPALSSSSTSCATGQFDGAIHKAAKQLVNDMIAVIPQLYGQPAPPPSLVQQAGPSAPALAPSAPALTFRSLLEDANHDLVLEGGEMVVLKMETTNTSSLALQNIEITLSGSQELVNAFRSSMDFPLNIGALQPGESRITEIRGKVPAITEKKRGELAISAVASNGQAPRTHRILASLQPGETHSNRLAVSKGTDRPTVAGDSSYLAVLVGLNTYRDPWPGTKLPFVGQLQPLADVLEVTGVFTGEHVKKLQGLQATKATIEEAIFSWARQRVTPETVLLFYFYGRALARASTGEVYLLPYDSSPNGSSKSLIPLQALQTALSKLNAKATLLFLDTPLLQAQVGNPKRLPNWAGAIPKLSKAGNNSLIQIRHRNPYRKGDSARMLAGLFSRADHNSDHSITLRELLDDLKGMGEITPSTPLSPAQADIPLTQ